MFHSVTREIRFTSNYNFSREADHGSLLMLNTSFSFIFNESCQQFLLSVIAKTRFLLLWEVVGWNNIFNRTEVVKFHEWLIPASLYQQTVSKLLVFFNQSKIADMHIRSLEYVAERERITIRFVYIDFQKVVHEYFASTSKSYSIFSFWLKFTKWA